MNVEKIKKQIEKSIADVTKLRDGYQAEKTEIESGERQKKIKADPELAQLDQETIDSINQKSLKLCDYMIDSLNKLLEKLQYKLEHPESITSVENADETENTENAQAEDVTPNESESDNNTLEG